MNKHRDPEALLSAYLAGGMEVLPDRVVDAVLDEVHRTRQRAGLGPWRTRSTFRTTLAAMAVVAVLVVGGALLTQRDRDNVAAPSATPNASARPTHPAVVTVTPTPTAEVLSLDLKWTEVDIEAGLGQVAWLDDRFVLVDSSGAVRTSTDGTSWEVLQPGDPDPGYAELLKERASLVTWEDQIVGWSNPQDGRDYTNKPPITARDVLRIVQPPAQPIVTTPFKGRIWWMGLGPAGFVAQTHVGDEESTENIAWFSADGIEWTETPIAFGEVVGVSDGFIASADEGTCTLPDGCSSMWHSPDGLTWRNLGHPDAEPESHAGRLLPWQGGALMTNGVGLFSLWTSQGYSELPMAADFPAPAREMSADVVLATGPLGLVSIRRDSLEVLVTRDGVDWKIGPMPAAMEPDSDYNLGPSVAVGDRSVLYLTWSGYWGEGEGYIPHLWVGSVEP